MSTLISTRGNSKGNNVCFDANPQVELSEPSMILLLPFYGLDLLRSFGLMTRALVLWFGGFDAYKTFVIMSCHTVQQMCFFPPAASCRCLSFLTAFSCFPPPTIFCNGESVDGNFYFFSNVVCVHDNLYNLSAVWHANMWTCLKMKQCACCTWVVASFWQLNHHLEWNTMLCVTYKSENLTLTQSWLDGAVWKHGKQKVTVLKVSEFIHFSLVPCVKHK